MGARGSDASDRSRSRSRSRCLLPPLRRKFPRPFPESSRVDCRNISAVTPDRLRRRRGHRVRKCAGRLTLVGRCAQVMGVLQCGQRS